MALLVFAVLSFPLTLYSMYTSARDEPYTKRLQAAEQLKTSSHWDRYVALVGEWSPNTMLFPKIGKSDIQKEWANSAMLALYDALKTNDVHAKKYVCVDFPTYGAIIGFAEKYCPNPQMANASSSN